MGMTRFNRRPDLAVLLALFSVCAVQSFAQTPSPRSEFETRAELEEQARIAESQHRTSEVFLLRSRLQNGDFQEGDRIVISLRSLGAPAVPETLVVRAGRAVQMAKMEDLSLNGVLRSELNDRFTEYVAKYYKDPEVRTTPLLRLGVFGSVGRQGYYYVSADLVLNDVIMRAGGPAPLADLEKVSIRRGSDVIWDEQAIRAALTDGLSLDRLHLRAGDDLVVPNKHSIPWLAVISVTIGLASAVLSIYQLTKR
jgi:hypothetical protein